MKTKQKKETKSRRCLKVVEIISVVRRRDYSVKRCACNVYNLVLWICDASGCWTSQVSTGTNCPVCHTVTRLYSFSV